MRTGLCYRCKIGHARLVRSLFTDEGTSERRHIAFLGRSFSWPGLVARTRRIVKTPASYLRGLEKGSPRSIAQGMKFTTEKVLICVCLIPIVI